MAPREIRCGSLDRRTCRLSTFCITARLNKRNQEVHESIEFIEDNREEASDSVRAVIGRNFCARAALAELGFIAATAEVTEVRQAAVQQAMSLNHDMTTYQTTSAEVLKKLLGGSKA